GLPPVARFVWARPSGASSGRPSSLALAPAPQRHSGHRSRCKGLASRYAPVMPFAPLTPPLVSPPFSAPYGRGGGSVFGARCAPLGVRCHALCFGSLRSPAKGRASEPDARPRLLVPRNAAPPGASVRVARRALPALDRQVPNKEGRCFVKGAT